MVWFLPLANVHHVILEFVPQSCTGIEAHVKNCEKLAYLGVMGALLAQGQEGRRSTPGPGAYNVPPVERGPTTSKAAFTSTASRSFQVEINARFYACSWEPRLLAMDYRQWFFRVLAVAGHRTK
jgi:hypothetical protein